MQTSLVQALCRCVRARHWPGRTRLNDVARPVEEALTPKAHCSDCSTALLPLPLVPDTKVTCCRKRGQGVHAAAAFSGMVKQGRRRTRSARDGRSSASCEMGRTAPSNE